MSRRSSIKAYSPYPGGLPFPPGNAPIPTEEIKLLVAAGSEIDWTQVVVTPANPNVPQPIQVHCDGASFDTIAPSEDLQLQFVPKGARLVGLGPSIELQGMATLIIRLHRMRGATVFLWPKVTVRYFKESRIVGETSWTSPTEH